MARVLGISEFSHHARRKRPPSKKQVAGTTLLKRVRTIHDSSRETFPAFHMLTHRYEPTMLSEYTDALLHVT